MKLTGKEGEKRSCGRGRRFYTDENFQKGAKKGKMKSTFRYGAAMLCLFLLMGFHAPRVYAADSGPEISVQEITETADYESAESYVPMDIQTAAEGEFKLLKKVFVVDAAVSPSVLIEPNLTRLGCSYEYLETLKEELPGERETKSVQKKIEIVSSIKDPAAIAAEQEQTLAYDEGGFVGELALDAEKIVVEDGEKQSYSYTVTDTKIYTGLASQDPYLVPKEVSKNGVTLTLSETQWTPVGVLDDGSGQPASYTATVSYSGQGWGSKTVGYKAILPYSGEVVKEVPGKVKYTVVYGEVKPAVQAENMDKSTEGLEAAPKKSVPKQSIWLMAAGGVLLAGAAALWVLKRRGEQV